MKTFFGQFEFACVVGLILLGLSGCEAAVQPPSVVITPGGVATNGGGEDPGPPPAPWACSVINTSTNEVSFEWGDSQSDASASAQQDCRNRPEGYFCGASECERTEEPARLWSCRVFDRRSDRIYSGVGDLRLQAKFAAQERCISDGDMNSFFCTSDDNLECSPEL